jgi:hypothetical protein
MRRLLILDKSVLSSAKDITLKQPIVVCPFDHASCREEMEAIEQSAKDAAHLSQDDPVPPCNVVRHNDPIGLQMLGIQMVGDQRKIVIE